MTKIAVDESQIQCTLGTSPQKIKVTGQTFIKIDSKLIATEKDKESMVNIPSFGSCKRVWYNPACTPSPVEWTQLCEHSTIDGLKKLTFGSTCKCNHGGEISFIDTADNKHVDSE